MGKVISNAVAVAFLVLLAGSHLLKPGVAGLVDLVVALGGNAP